MKVAAAFLCDAATVREGLLHVLGGGVTRLWIDEFPAPMNVAVALLLELDRSELGRPHQLDMTVMDEDGGTIASVQGGFQFPPNPSLAFGENALIPFTVPLHLAAVPKLGQYSISVQIDNVLHSRLMFAVRPTSDRLPSRSDPPQTPDEPLPH
jgi:hypothetical protein